MDPQQPPRDPHEIERIERLRQAMYSRKLSENIHERERRELDPTQFPVGDDWGDKEGSLPRATVAPRGMHLARTLLWWVLALALLFFIGAVGYFVYYFTFGSGSLAASQGNIDIAVSGPPEIDGGQITEFQISVTNRNKVPLDLADLVVTFPLGTRSPTDFITDEPSLRQSLGTIEPGASRQGVINAVLTGEQGSHSDMKVEVEYRLSGSSAVFVSSTDYPVTFGSEPLSIAVDSNTQTTSGQPIQLTANVSSNTNTPIKDVLMTVDYPFGFKFKSAVPAPISDGVWSLGDVLPGSKHTVVINGTLSGEAADERIFQFSAGTRKTQNSPKIDTQLANNAVHMTISQPFLGLTVSVNKGSGPSVIVQPGDTVTVSIAYQNNLSTAITNGVIVAKLTGVQIDGTTVHSTDGFYRSTDDAMLWDQNSTNGALASLAPGDRGVVQFSFVMPAGDALKGLTDPSITISINAAGNRVSESGVPENLQSTAQQKIALASDLQFTAQGLYYQNPFGSTGPMPPKAETETTYAIVLTVNNGTNQIKGATIKAILPPYVRWEGKYSPPSENISFNPNDSSITWNLNDIDPGVGLNGTPPRQAAIAIGFTPSTSQIGQQPVLLQKITLDGKDAATGADITRTLQDVTTNLAQVSKSSQSIIVGTDAGFTSANSTVVAK